MGVVIPWHWVAHGAELTELRPSSPNVDGGPGLSLQLFLGQAAGADEYTEGVVCEVMG